MRQVVDIAIPVVLAYFGPSTDSELVLRIDLGCRHAKSIPVLMTEAAAQTRFSWLYSATVSAHVAPSTLLSARFLGRPLAGAKPLNYAGHAENYIPNITKEVSMYTTNLRTRIVQASIVSLALVCTSVTLAGCAEQSSSTPFFTSRGTLVQTAPASVNVPGRVGIHDGLYQGTANAVFTGAGRCTATQTVTDFHVRNNVAKWAGYTGTIDPTGAVEMHRGFEYLTGRFAGNRFGGRLETGAWSNRPSCVYTMTLQRVGA